MGYYIYPIIKKQMKGIPTDEQVLAAKYFTVSDTGLITEELKQRCNNSIDQLYDHCSQAYEEELGCGLGEELRDWKKIIKMGLHEDLIAQWEKNKGTFSEFKDK